MTVTQLSSVLITGASSGLGAHFGRVLADAGYHVILAARRLEKVTTLASEIVADGGSVESVAMDVTSADSVEAAFASMAQFPSIIINNAGVSGAATALDMSEQEFASVIDTNLKGVFLVSQMAARGMRQQGTGGVIVNVASILGLRVAGGVSAYAASKAALIHMTKAHALEWARWGIRVNALCPGYIETPLNSAFFATDAGQALIRRIPQRRLGQLSDLNAPLLLLVSDQAAYITGCALPVDGGHLVSSL